MRPLTEQTVMITGATDGLGRYVAGELAARGAHLIVHGRDEERAEALRAEIRERGGPEPQVLLADLADLRAVDRLADTVRARLRRLDVLVNNAGIGFGEPGGGRRLSADGYELRFAVNHLAGYLLTRELLGLLTSSAPARVVNVSSVGQRAIDFSDPMLRRDYDGYTAYARSKLAQIMFTFDLAGELDGSGVTVNALHPATLMDTTMVRTGGVGARSTVEEGGAALLHLITDPALDGVSGRYFEGQRESRADPQAYDPAARERLRRLSDDLVERALAGDASRATR